MKTSVLYSYSKEEIQNLVNNSYSIKDFMKKVGFSSEGGNRKTVYRVFKEYNINLSILENNRKKFLSEKIKNLQKNNIISLEEILIKNSSYNNRTNLKKKLVENNLLEYKCSECNNLGNWLEKKLVLVLDHINGINNDNRLENLRFLCPNCNSQTSTFCGKHKRNSKLLKKEFKEKEKKFLIEKRKNSLKEIDLNKFGWVNEVAKKWNISHTQVKRWIKKYYPNLIYYEKKALDGISTLSGPENNENNNRYSKYGTYI